MIAAFNNTVIRKCATRIWEMIKSYTASRNHSSKMKLSFIHSLKKDRNVVNRLNRFSRKNLTQICVPGNKNLRNWIWGNRTFQIFTKCEKKETPTTMPRSNRQRRELLRNGNARLVKWRIPLTWCGARLVTTKDRISGNGVARSAPSSMNSYPSTATCARTWSRRYDSCTALWI